MNIEDSLPDVVQLHKRTDVPVIPGQGLTFWERIVEEQFTPKLFYDKDSPWFYPSSEDFGCTLVTDEQEPIHLFYPTSYSDFVENYAYEVEEEDIFVYGPHPHYEKGKHHFKDPNLSSLEFDWEYSELTIQRFITHYRLLHSHDTTHNVFFFF